MYYNPDTQETLSYQELKNFLNCSFPIGTEVVNGWLCIHESYPEEKEGYVFVRDSIKMEDGQAIQTYRLEPIPEQSNQEQALSLQNEMTALQEKISDLEECIKDLAEMMSNLQIYCTNAVDEIKGVKK